MRRTNTRKRNKINFKNLNIKSLKIIYALIFLLFSLVLAYIYFFNNVLIKHNFEKDYTAIYNLNEETIFSLDKIVLFSSASVDTKELNNSVWNLDISQYTDICIYINNIMNKQNQSKNIIKELYIDNIIISDTEYGTPYLYRKSINDFGKCSFNSDNLIAEDFNFNIISSDKQINYSNNEMYNDLSVPLTIGYYNKGIKTDFLFSESVIEYNGKILKAANIPQTSIKCQISFCINITNELNEKYIYTVSIDIPFESENKSIYEDGYITKAINNLDNYKFLRVK